MTKAGKIVDCRRCAYFKEYDKLDARMKNRAWRMLSEMNRTGRPLGWCYRYWRPVTYYRGKCRGFVEKREALRSLIEFLRMHGDSLG